MDKVTCYAIAGKPKHKMICEAFAAGCGGDVVFVPEGSGADVLRPGIAMLYGVMEPTYPLWLEILKRGVTYYYADNAYFGREQFFRITKNAHQHKGLCHVDHPAHPTDKFLSFEVPIKPWRFSRGEQVMVCTQTPLFYQLRGYDIDKWIQQVKDEIAAVSKRPVYVRSKTLMKVEPFIEAVQKAWAVVSFSSNANVEAILEGIPSFVTFPDCAAYPLSLSDLSKIEDPHMPANRLQWASNLAYHQWSIAEIAAGQCWRDLNSWECAK